jgi:predicted TIM-barrel fold metal-dependent hydrolase
VLYDGPRTDSDVHHNWRREADLLAYLPARWQDYLRGGRHPLTPPAIFNPAPNGITSRLDAFPDDGGPPASDLELMRRQLLDPFNITHAIVSFDTGANVALSNLELSVEIGRALNRWSIDHWLSGQDDRIYGSLLVNTQVPEVGAQDIREFGKHPRMSEALLLANGAGKPFGHPVYEPIFRAAVEMDMPLSIHIGGDTFLPGTATHTAAGGLPNTRFERHSLQMQPVQHYLLSFITHGVFERYGDLRLIVKETGVAWIPWFFWEVDAAAPILRAESSWVRRPPSEYLRKHTRLTTQPLEEPAQFDQLIEMLEAVGGMEDLLCFSTDYPHHDSDDPDQIARRLPVEWWDRVFYENGRQVYGWPDDGHRRLAERKAAIASGKPSRA